MAHNPPSPKSEAAKYTPPVVRDKYKGRSYQRYLDWISERTKKKVAK